MDKAFLAAFLIALVPASASVIAVIITTIWQNRKLFDIHVLVNSQLQTALSKISALETRIMALTGTHSVKVLQDETKRD